MGEGRGYLGLDILGRSRLTKINTDDPIRDHNEAPNEAHIEGAARLITEVTVSLHHQTGLDPAGPFQRIAMSVEEQNAVIGQWIEAWNKQDLDAAEDLLAPDYVRHDANMPDVDGPKAELEFIAGVVSAFPDLYLRAEQVIAQDELVAARLSLRGTHQGEFLGVPATGREVAFESMEVFRLASGKIAEQWVVMNALGLFQQLGAIPSPA